MMLIADFTEEQCLYTYQAVLANASEPGRRSDESKSGKARKQREIFERKSVGEPRGTNLSKRGVAR